MRSDKEVYDATTWSAGPVLQILPQSSYLTTRQVLYGNTTPDPELVSMISTLTHLQRVMSYHGAGIKTVLV